MNPTAAPQVGTKPFEAAAYLQSDEDCAQHLQACMDEAPEDAALFTKAVSDIARARGMMQLAKGTGITREGCTRPWANTATSALQRGCQSHARAWLAVQCGCALGGELISIARGVLGRLKGVGRSTGYCL